MKYLVIARHWDNDKRDIVNYIAGSFDKYINAAIFRDAYNKTYSADAKVVEADKMINA